MKRLRKSVIILAFLLVSCGPGTPSNGTTPPFVPVSPPAGSLSTEPPATEPPATEPPTKELKVDVDVVFDNCSCRGDFQNATVILTINNGEPPFNISGSGPVNPVNDKLVTFPVPVGSSFPLDISSNDGLSWKTDNIDASSPYSCNPPPSCNSGGGDNGKTCHNEDVENCELVEVMKTVCTQYAGNSGNCKKWEDIVTYEEVCTTTVEEVCN